MSKIKVVVVLQNKGGVTKTTSSSLLAEAASLLRDKRVLLIDFDGQCNLTSQWIGHDEVRGEREPPINPDIEPGDLDEFNERSAITDIFLDGKSVETYLTPIGTGNKDDVDAPRVELVACSGSGMRRIQENIQVPESTATHGRQLVEGVATSQVIRGLHDFCHAEGMDELYDLIIIDTGPGVNTLFRAALAAATHVVSPYIPESLSVLGIGPLIQQVETANENRFYGGAPIEFIGLLPSKVDTRSPVHQETMKAMASHPAMKGVHFPEGMFVPSSVHIQRRSTTNRPRLDPYSIFQMKPSEPIRRQCESVFLYMLDKIFDESKQQEVQHG